MGKWKWEVDIYKARVRKGKIIIEISWLDRAAAEMLFKKASYKLPVKTKLVWKSEMH